MKYITHILIFYVLLNLCLSVGLNNALLFRRDATGSYSKSWFMENFLYRSLSPFLFAESLQKTSLENTKTRNITSNSFPNNFFPEFTQNRKLPFLKRVLQIAFFSSIFQYGNIQSIELHLATQFGTTTQFKVSLHPQQVFADDELAQYAAEGNKVGVDGQCFLRKCALETSSCANDPSANCLKGLSCLARYAYLINVSFPTAFESISLSIYSCKGGSMCSTGCFAKYGSDKLDNLLSCSVEKNDCS